MRHVQVGILFLFSKGQKNEKSVQRKIWRAHGDQSVSFEEGYWDLYPVKKCQVSAYRFGHGVNPLNEVRVLLY
jgi:GMP synthase-like glutamine amidotransferase